ncbi:Methyltransf_11 domain-containing protein [Candidatus Nitrotoga sp. HW29]|uniref:methyltransferase domain-containing protein n=1 Tax=Candidatus Nitrotoga sp. HW29 TaxID=2886963 RepID=UPI001EF1F8D4|nr:methyltransferase domain-containing protein [Candidatus Nitrotoga sp. HW29]CAH1903938.1 Methyltransf_11 domain-containing protein [Candidatus Nitrotoga sp. HW29]
MNQPNNIDPAELNVQPIANIYQAGQIIKVQMNLQIRDICIFDPVMRLFIRREGADAYLVASDTHQGGIFLPWLPRGEFCFNFEWPVSLPPGNYELGVSWGTVSKVRTPDSLQLFSINGVESAQQLLLGTWSTHPETEARLNQLSWRQGMTNWFHRHFCHAAKVIGELCLANSEKLQGRILDIGAGEGITDLSIVLRYQPQELVALDIVDYIKELPRVCQENGLPLQKMPDNFTFLQQSCEEIPYADESFDVVISWGSLEHIAGGYKKTLDEVYRVLKPGGLFFVAPGLYYSAIGSHLGEFDPTPHLHLRIPEADLKEMVMTTKPTIMDRSGFNVTNEDYWRFYKELNPIRLADFENELRSYGYILLRAAIRTSEVVEYDAALQPYSILDLAVEEPYIAVQKPEKNLNH